MKINELRQEIERKTAELASKIEARDVEGAKALKKEIEEARELLKISEEQESEERAKLEAQKNSVEARGVDKMGKVNEFRAVVKKIMGAEMTDEERAVIKTSDNAPLFPKEFIAEVEKLKAGYGALKAYTHVIPVHSMEGTKPVVDLAQNALANIGEGADIVEGALVSTEITYKCSKVGLVDVLSAESVDDAAVDIESLVKENFMEIAVVNENAKIVNIIKANATDATTSASYKDLMKQMDGFAPAIKNGLVTVTNGQGFAFLKGLSDKQDRPLNLVTEMNGKYYFNGKELVVVDDSLLEPTEATKNVFITCNMKEAVKFFDRKAITVEKWREPKNDTQNISILERFDVKKGASTRSIVKFEL